MPKLNVFALTRPARPAEERTFEENGAVLTLALAAPDAADMARAAESATEMVRDYITGSDVREAASFPEGIKVSESLFQAAALVAEMQTATEPVERYTPMELVMLAVKLPRTWAAIQTWAAELVSTWSARRGNSPGAPTAASAG